MAVPRCWRLRDETTNEASVVEVVVAVGVGVEVVVVVGVGVEVGVGVGVGVAVVVGMTAQWRVHATPEELAEHDGLIAADRANAARRRIIRNRCRMRGLPGPVFHGRNV